MFQFIYTPGYHQGVQRDRGGRNAANNNIKINKSSRPLYYRRAQDALSECVQWPAWLHQEPSSFARGRLCDQWRRNCDGSISFHLRDLVSAELDAQVKERILERVDKSMGPTLWISNLVVVPNGPQRSNVSTVNVDDSLINWKPRRATQSIEPTPLKVRLTCDSKRPPCTIILDNRNDFCISSIIK